MTRVDFTLASLAASGALRPVDVALARALARLGPEGARDAAVVAAVALASAALAEGHVRLPLAATGELVRARTEGAATTTAPDDLAARLARSGLLAARAESPEGSPLVIDDDALYLRRYAEHERRIADVVNRLADATAPPSASAAPLTARLDALFGEASRDGRGAAQRRAAEVALERRLVLVSGGPGTGKTWTVARLLALQIEQAVAMGRPTPAIVLAAPTGKAATRLEEAIAKERDALPVDERVRLALPSRARTLHRVLGSVGGSGTRFQHGQDAPLPADLVVVDEASMIDVGLFRRMLDAIGPATRLVLLGDPDQLPSVEAGSVFADLVASPAASAVGRCLVRLTESRRFDPASGVGRLADAIRRGDAEEALATLRAGGAVALEDAVPRDGLGEHLEELARQGFRGVLDASEAPATRLGALERFRVLAAHRAGPYGTTTLNAHLSTLLLRGGRRRAHAEDGRVLLVTTNDYDTGLFNGDLGLACVHPQDTTRRLHAWFPALTGPEPRRVPPARLPAHETAFAMTVHKSQGSEADTVAVVLPDESSPLLGRELFYTAVTRARARVVVFGGEASVRRAVETRTERWSGLRARLA